MAQRIRRRSTEPEILGSNPSRITNCRLITHTRLLHTFSHDYISTGGIVFFSIFNRKYIQCPFSHRQTQHVCLPIKKAPFFFRSSLFFRRIRTYFKSRRRDAIKNPFRPSRDSMVLAATPVGRRAPRLCARRRGAAPPRLCAHICAQRYALNRVAFCRVVSRFDASRS